MLKIEITDPHLLDKNVLTEITQFLMKLSDQNSVAPTVPNITPPSPIDVTPAYNPFNNTPSVKNNVELDINGLPWDARIHSRTKSKTDKGIWKLQRGVDMNLVDKVSKELLDIVPTGYKIAAISEPNTGGPITIISETYEPPKPTVLKSPIPQPPPAITQPSDDPMEPETDTFPLLMAKITSLIAAKKITREQVNDAVKSVNIPSLPLVATRPDLVPKISSYIDLLIS
jgi:hypothetical protein